MRFLPAATLLLLAGCASQIAPTASPSPAPAVSPTPGGSPAPTASASVAPTSLPPSPTGTATGLLVDAALISQHLDALQQIADANGGIRAAGMPGYDASAGYVAEVMTDLGFQVERQPFDFAFYNETGPVTVTLGDLSWSSPDWVHAALYSASGDADGALEHVTGGCDAGDWSDFTAGHVALVESGGCFTRQKVENAQLAGAVAMIDIVSFWNKDEIRRPTLLHPDGITIPVVVAGSEPWSVLPQHVGEKVSVHVQGENRTATVDNIIATLPGQSDEVVMLGAHLDSVLDGPGINDNGSGVATLMALAASIANGPQPANTIRFGFWSAEEFGDLGSAAYVGGLDTDERQQIQAYLNLDMVGSPNPARYVYSDTAAPAGSAAITQALLDALNSLGKPGIPLDMGAGSDHYNFELAGIPSGGLFSGLSPMSMSDAAVFDGIAGAPEDPCYHLACDTRANVNVDNAVLLGQAIADYVEGAAY